MMGSRSSSWRREREIERGIIENRKCAERVKKVSSPTIAKSEREGLEHLSVSLSLSFFSFAKRPSAAFVFDLKKRTNANVT